MLCSPHGPAEDGNPKQFLFRYPAKVKCGETLNKHGNIDVTLMVRHENVLPFRVDLAQAFNVHRHAADCEDYLGPEGRDALHVLTVGIKGSKQNYQESRRHGDQKDHKQLEAIRHGEAGDFNSTNIKDS